MKRTTLGIGIVLASWTAMASAATPGTIEFKYVHTPGKVSRMNLVTKVVGSMKMPDPMPEQKFVETIEQQLVAKCIKVNSDGSALYEMRMPVITMKMDVGGMKMDIHSDAPTTQGASTFPGSDNMQKLYAAMAKGKFLVTLARDGRPVKVEGWAKVMQDAMKSLGNLSAQEMVPLKAMSAMFDDDQMREQLEVRADFLSPRGTLRIGDTWKNDREMKFPMFNIKLRNITECTLLGIEKFRGRSCAKIGLKASMQTLPPAAAPAAASQPGNVFQNMDFSLTTTDGTGVVYWDYENGEQVQFRETSRMICEILMKNMPNTGGKEPSKPFKMVQNLLTSTSMDLLDTK